MATSDVGICNMALSYVKAKVITSLTELSANAELCRVFFQQSVDVVLSAHPWNCSTTRQTLAQVVGYVNPDVHRYQHAYTLPVDPYCLRVFEVFPDERYVIEGRRLLTDSDQVAVRYAFRLADYSAMHPEVIEVIADYLAYKLAFPLNQSPTLMETRFKIYKDRLAEARSMDSQEGGVQTMDIGDLVQVRRQAGNLDFERNQNSV